MRRVTIGIYVDEGAHRVAASLTAVRANTVGAAQIVLLPDGPDDMTRARLPALGVPVVDDAGRAAGASACFNRLAGFDDADVIVFLEAGAIPGPGWLDAILAALESDPRNGLAGPSTNSAWNEQAAFPGAGGTLVDVARTAQLAAQRFGRANRTLEPLHSLVDFCYAVRCEVVEAIGRADEEYGLGPCWEMDYNIRAARAGFRGVWAGAAYVWRAPFTTRRQGQELRRFEINKQRYQDKFCALRIRRERPGYEAHCRGDACEHFAPAALIDVREPVPRPRLADAPPPPAAPLAARSSAIDLPLVSCIMATRDRPEYVLQSVDYFVRQDYPNRELIILDDGTADMSPVIPVDDRIRYVRVPRGTSIGAKRNRGCELARGTIIAQWDDDDWYAARRLSAQVAPIVAREADITGLKAEVFFDLAKWEFWSCTPSLHQRMFVEDVHGGTLTYRRACWETLARYPDCSLAEDAALLRGAMARGARLKRLTEPGLYVYLRHGRNSWQFQCGQFMDPSGWVRIGEPSFAPRDRAFYAARSAAAPPPRADAPLVTCIMPTADRRSFVPNAIRWFLRQTYAARELIIVDDGADPVGDLVPACDHIRYVRLDGRRSLGAKRNLACELARGDLIAHWDDDDWAADWRLAYQVDALTRHAAPAVCGLSTQRFYEPSTGRAWRYAYPSTERAWVAGNTLCYHKALWQRFPFPEVNEGEDTRFIWTVPPASIAQLTDERFHVATVHAGNTSYKRTGDVRWCPTSSDEVRALMGDDWESYHVAARG